MANSKNTTDYKAYATVDTAPAAGGYWTGPISMRDLKEERTFFSVRGTGVMTVTLQFKCPDDADWTDFGNYVIGDRKLLEGGAAGVLWRMGVAFGDWTSGSLTFGFDW